MRTATLDREFTGYSTERSTSRKASPKAKQKTPKINPTASIRRWAYAGVGLTLLLSAGLNGLAFSTSAPSPIYGWTLGIAIPTLILIFSRVSALLYQSGLRRLAYVGAATTMFILLLSVQHCAVSIAMLTGEHVALATLMSIAIDCGLVLCECVTALKK